MKKYLFLFCIFALIGCNYGGEGFQSYLEDPRSLIKDPHYKHYKEKRDSLESAYLNKEISYVDYTERMKTLDNAYTVEVENRRKIIESNY